MGSEKGAVECDVGLGLKMQRTESFPCKKMTTTEMAAHQLPYYHHHPRQLSSSSCGFGTTDGGLGGGGLIYSAGNKQVACMGDVYDVVGAGSVVSLPTTLHHHFNTDSTATFKSYSSSSGIAASAAASGRVPFTALQLQELERQTIVYNYMRASIPIPSELCFPITKSLSSSSSDHVAAAAPKSNRLWDMGCTNNGTDPEPWRCRRTDGKKWRCSRNVEPDQKYCERHTHKNKPRSRKPVEQVQQSHSTVTNSLINKTTRPLQHKPQFVNQMDHHHVVSPYPTLVSATPYEQQSRYTDWFMKGGTNSVSSSNQPWQQQQQQQQQHLTQSTVGMKRYSTDCYKNVCVYDQQQHEESMNVNDQCSLFLGHKLVSLEGALNLGHTGRPREFIDAWSIAERDGGINEISHNHKCSVSSNGKLPLSSLTLSMPGDNRTNDEEEHGQMGIGMLESAERENAGGTLKSQSLLNWMNPGSWMNSGSTPGGPLAEALCLGMTSTSKTVSSNPEYPHGGNSSTTNSSHGKSPSGDGSQGFNLM